MSSAAFADFRTWTKTGSVFTLTGVIFARVVESSFMILKEA
jgi:hypothetical protein